MIFQNVLYFKTVYRLLWAKTLKKNFKKQYISTKLDKGYRLGYELSYQVKKIFWSIFIHWGALTKKKSNIFIWLRKKFPLFFLERVPPNGEKWTKIYLQPDTTIYTPIGSPCRV
jgi:aromatic ring-opening dioxygenase LigB subunit